MKKVLLMTAMILALVSMAIAQDATVEKKWNAYLGAGASLPMGDFGDAYKLGFHGAGAFGYTVYPGLQIMPKVEFHAFPIDKDAGAALILAPVRLVDPAATVTIDGGNLKAIMFGADGRYAFKMENSKIAPFVLGGLGMAALSSSDVTVDLKSTVLGDTTFTGKSESTTKVYFEIGGGVEFAMSPTLNLFIQARYASISTEGKASAFIPITVGVKF